jgi:RsiW-degrading membrane proteinase PrsW (M82 family)
MNAPGSVAVQNPAIAPPYPAAVSILGSLWRSPLARDGRVVLAKPAIQIGRMDGNDITLTDPLVSRYHAAIRWAPHGYEIEDLGSANGTFVQGLRVQGRLPLSPGQTIRIGNTELHFTALDSSQQAPAPAGGAGAISPSGSPSNPGVGAATIAPPAPFAPMQPAPSMAPPVGAGQIVAPHPYYGMMPPRRENAIARFFKTQGRKRYWRVFLLGILAYFVVYQVLTSTNNLHLVPLQLLIASALVPVVFVIFCWEQSAFADMPPAIVGLTFLSGAILGLTIAAVVEPLLLPSTTGSNGIDLGSAILIGVVEETAKIIAIAWFLRNKRLRSELDGLIIGAAAGMGFAALETAGYGFTAFLTGFIAAAQAGGGSLDSLFNAGVSAMNHQLLVRMALAIFGHGVWTGIVCAVIWRERGQSTFRVTPSVIVAFFIAVGLHALWDWSPLASTITDSTDQVTAYVIIFGWFLFVGVLGLLILRFLLRESLERAKLGPMAPPPPPLLRAMLASFGRRRPQPAWQPYGWPQNAPMPAPIPPAPGMGGIPSMPPQLQQQPAAPPMQSPPMSPAWPVAQAPNAGVGRPAYCPRCGLTYPPGTQICARCNGRLT